MTSIMCTGYFLRKIFNPHSPNNRSKIDGCSYLVRQYGKDPDDNDNKSKNSESILSGTSGTYVEDMYKIWQKDPASVHASWDSYFRNELKGHSYTTPERLKTTTRNIDSPISAKLVNQDGKKKVDKISIPRGSIQKAVKQSGISSSKTEVSNITDSGGSNKSIASEGSNKTTDQSKPVHKTFARSETSSIQAAAPSSTPPSSTVSGGGGNITDDKTIQHHLAVQAVIRSYQARGHLVTQLDPLGILYTDRKTTVSDRFGHPPDEVTRQHKMGLTEMDKVFTLPSTTFIGGKEKALPLKEIIKRMEVAYCRHIAVEYMYIHSMEHCNWIRQRIEPVNAMNFSKEQKTLILKRLARASGFESFLAKKWTAEKRFGLEGCEVLIPALKQIIDVATSNGLDSVNIGMAHRGRLNVLANICRKPLEDIFAQFAGLEAADEGSGDVKYHLGTSGERENRINKKKVKIAVLANPSHLEAVDTLVLGKTLCEQFMQGDTDGKKTVALFIHGDASFCGQGIVYESFHLSYLPDYTTKGTIHVVVNNQVGFTTDPRFSRSSRYCTDVGRVVSAPIFHVNADDPESVIHVCNIAAEWRQTFQQDVVIDLVCYRRNGHNEMDEPMFTQPLMYQKIRKLPNVVQLYGDKLIKEGIATKEEIANYIKEYEDICEKAFAKAKDIKIIRYSDWLDSPWKGFFKNFKFDAMPKTGIKEEILQHIGNKFSTEPSDFVCHRGILRILKNRRKMVDARVTDWSLGEAFAYGSLMKEGVHVRLSGQDVERGTFSHRHHILHHQTEDMKTYNMLANLYPDQAKYTVRNSALSEYGVLGFEVGYSLVSPHNLVMWEGQFGDFSNTAQVIFDQFISSQQSKWVRQCGLVVQLPHAMEGMGPEHSSSRLERFLSMCDEDIIQQAEYNDEFVRNQHLYINWFVANCTTPASLFHILRRQIYLPFRKPLILMTPKSLLRHPMAQSKFDAFLEGTEFQRVIPDRGPASQNPENVKKLVFCCGKTYYDILGWLKEHQLEDKIAVVRTEQLSPFPYDLVAKELKLYANANVVWAQEEHKNQGGWLYMRDRIIAASNGTKNCSYNGRPYSPSPATGNKAQHLKEIADYMAELIKI